MDRKNRFEERFNLVTDSRDATENIRSKLVEGTFEYNQVKRAYAIKEKELNEKRAEVNRLKITNRGLKVNMVLAMIERDELEAKKGDLQAKLHKVEQDIDGLDRQSDYILRSVGASHHSQNKS